jgi:hypothetical protein
MAASQESRIRKLEAKVQQLLSADSQTNHRTAAPMAARNGRWYVELYTDVVAGGTGTASILVPNFGELIDSGKTLEVTEIWLPEGSTLSAGERFWVYWYRTCWVRELAGTQFNIRFTIQSADPLTRSVLGTVLAWAPHTFSKTELPGYDPLQNAVTICDPHGCIFNEPEGELLGRTGTATYRMPEVGQAEPCQTGSYVEAQWEADTLCCPTPACDEGA